MIEEVINPIFRPLYNVYLDGYLIGIVEEEDYAWNFAEDYSNGTPIQLHHDDVDRVSTQKINVNRFVRDFMSIVDRFTNKSTLCAGYTIANDGVERYNELQLEKERAEAKIRAMTL